MQKNRYSCNVSQQVLSEVAAVVSARRRSLHIPERLFWLELLTTNSDDNSLVDNCLKETIAREVTLGTIKLSQLAWFRQ